MVFQVQPSGKKKKIIGRRQRRASYQNYQQAFANTDETPGTAPNQAEEPAADPTPPLPKKRKDDNHHSIHHSALAKYDTLLAGLLRIRGEEQECVK